MNKLKYVYHVVYYFGKDDGTTGIGATTIYRATKLDTQEEVEDITDFIAKNNELAQVVILNFILLNRRGKR